MSFGIGITANLGEIESLKGKFRLILKNATTGVPEAVMSLMSNVRSVAVSKTHTSGTKHSGRLAAGWVVKRQFNRYSLLNDVFYAQREFGRPGVKTRSFGTGVGTPHDIVPQLMDLISSNIEKVAQNALMNGVR